MIRKVPLFAALVALLASLMFVALQNPESRAEVPDASANEDCRPDGLHRTPNVNVPYCLAYDTEGREKMGADHPRRIIGYFTSWRTGKNGQPGYLAKDIPWSKVTHLNYAFAHIGADNRASVGSAGPNNPSIGMEWPGVAGAELDPSLPYKGHFNLLNKYKKQYPDVKTMISIGGWAETGGFIDDNGNRVASGGFYTMTDSQATINTFADSVVDLVRRYGFNGADIDYEYATSMPNSGNPLDFSFSNPRRARLMAGYVALMKTLREKLDAASAADGKYYLLTVAAPSSGYMLRGMETYQVVQFLDYVNVMSYDLHGAWNHFVGPNASLFDDGKDAELAAANVYGTPQYGGIGYLNGDWSYHYFRGAMQAGRINLGVPYYTRGWRGVSGGTNGLWGRAALPDQTKCPPGTGSSVGSTTPCGNGAIGADNIWHDLDNGKEVPAGSNPLWHAKNLQDGKLGSYAAQYGLTPATDPDDALTGTYTRHYDSTLVAPWLWNEQKKVFLSTEDEQSIAAKAQYVLDRGLGGIMIWELAGDYAKDTAKNEYFMGSTLTTTMYDRFRTGSAYGSRKAKHATPAETLDVAVEFGQFPVGDANYPISPKARITNNSALTIPGGAELQFDHGTSAPANMQQQSGWTLAVTRTDHSGPNVGGLKGDLHRISLKLPSWQSLAPGASADVAIVYYLPITTPSNLTLTFGGRTYGLRQDHARGAGGTPTTTTTSSTTSTTTSTTTTTTSSPVCTAPAWSSGATYTQGNEVSHKGRKWRAKWWTKGEEPGSTGEWGVWQDLGAC